MTAFKKTKEIIKKEFVDEAWVRCDVCGAESETSRYGDYGDVRGWASLYTTPDHEGCGGGAVYRIEPTDPQVLHFCPPCEQHLRQLVSTKVIVIHREAEGGVQHG